MSKKPRKMVTMSKDMFSVFMTWAFFMGWGAPSVYTYMVLRYG